MSSGSREGGPTFLFLHVMKTGGTSVLGHAWKQFGRYGVEPALLLGDDPADAGIVNTDYESLARVRDLPPARRASVRFYAGHYPFLVRDVVQPDVTLTVLREPVERTVSILRQLRRGHRRMGGQPFEAIYDDPMLRASMIVDYQVKQFALTRADLDEHAARVAAFRGGAPEPTDKPHLSGLDLDEQRVELALANLALVDHVGFQRDLDGFVAGLRDAYGWEEPDEGEGEARLRTAPADDEPVPDHLLARIAEELRWDREFYARAVEQVAGRVGGAGP